MLRELAAEGLVTTIPQKGAIVVVPTVEEAAEVYEVRAALEALAARRFVARASDADVAALRAAFAEVEEVTHDGGDIQAMLRAKDRFYDVLLEGAGNGSVVKYDSTIGSAGTTIVCWSAIEIPARIRIASVKL